uniref:(northern house mosquito) hypothetical protein n=1 Tax=Culex pipiens TaxID=7175 RepID=A0A8D8J283_CULPI
MCVPFARLRELFPLPLNVGSASFSTVCFPTSRQRKLGLGRGILLQLFSIYYFTFVFFSFVIRYNCCVFFLIRFCGGAIAIKCSSICSLFFFFIFCLLLLFDAVTHPIVLHVCSLCISVSLNASMCHPRLHVLGVCG